MIFDQIIFFDQINHYFSLLYSRRKFIAYYNYVNFRLINRYDKIIPHTW